MKSKIVVITGHPDSQSFCTALADAYISGASGSGAEVRQIRVGELDFNPILKHGYQQRTELEPDLVKAQESIRWADHLVLVYPNWWGVMPAVLKGFIDRVFLPGFAFKYRDNSALWDKLLTGKSAHLIITMDTPSWYNKWIYKQAGQRIMKNNILKFCGVSPVRATEIGPVKPSSPERRAKWLQQVKKLGSGFM